MLSLVCVVTAGFIALYMYALGVFFVKYGVYVALTIVVMLVLLVTYIGVRRVSSDRVMYTVMETWNDH